MENNIQAKGITEVEVLKVKDVRDNELLYLRIWNINHTENIVVNIGLKTYQGVQKMLQPRETTTQLNILPEEKTKKAS